MPRAVEVHLTPSEERGLLRQREDAKSRKAWKRITAILLLTAGLATAKILHTLAISRRTLLNWKRRWLKGRHFRFEDAPRTGRPALATASYIKEMVRVVQRDPREFGYAFTRWTAPRLAEYLHRETRILLTPEWISELLGMHGIAWRRTKRTIRNLQNRAATKRAQKALRRLKKGLWTRGPITNSGSRTASASSSCRSRRTPTGVVASR